MSADKDYLVLPIREFLADLAAKRPTPGGGSVAAMAAATAVAQARMVVAYSLSKGASDREEARLLELTEELRRAGEMFGQLIREDMAAYERFAAAGKQDDPQERERAVATAATVPMEIVVLSGAVLARLDEVKTFVNQRLVSDLQVAAILAYSAAEAAGVSVRINLDGLSDREEAERLDRRLDMLLGRADRNRNGVVHYQVS